MSSALAGGLGVGAVKAENEKMLFDNHFQISGTRKQSFPGSMTQIYKEGKQLSFLQSTNCNTTTLPEASVCSQQHISANYSAFCNAGNNNTQKVFSNWFYRDEDADESDCALSLLSTTPNDNTKEIGLSHFMESNHIPQAQPLIPSLHYNGLEMVGEPAATSSILFADGSNTANLHCQDMYKIRPDGSSSNAPHQKLSFSWD